MFKIIEAFSGIGSQAKALKNIGVDYELIGAMDWDINAIIAYDIIHNGKPNLSCCENMTVDEIRMELKEYTISYNSKAPVEEKSIGKMKEIIARHLYAAIKRTNNFVSITDVKGYKLPEEIDLFTYSFPCQDLSIARAWHGENGGIDRGAENRSGMLWEVERILQERVENGMKLPKFLLMENVSNILSKRHIDNFKEWQAILKDMGYHNKVYNLNAADFGIPQRRKRAYMISVLCNEKEESEVSKYLTENDLSNQMILSGMIKKHKSLDEILKLDYSNETYKREADISQPNNTPSREKIYRENTLLFDGEKILVNTVQTLTTKQDRNPNSGILNYNSDRDNKIHYRNLTTRECFMLMGFEEEDYQSLIDNNFRVTANRMFFTQEKLYRMAGNSIVVNVLEEIFKLVMEINKNILK